VHQVDNPCQADILISATVLYTYIFLKITQKGKDNTLRINSKGFFLSRQAEAHQMAKAMAR
jgi:hypothetical protein